jgi:hypothetical protein
VGQRGGDEEQENHPVTMGPFFGGNFQGKERGGTGEVLRDLLEGERGNIDGENSPGEEIVESCYFV